MSKPFEGITEAGFELLEQILKQPNTLQGDFFFDEPTVDGQIELLLAANLVECDDDAQLSITELGRAALKHHDYIMEQNALIQKQRTEELEAFKSIANSMQQQLSSISSQADSTKAIADSADKQANSAAKLAELATQQSKEAKKASKGANFRSYLSIAIAVLSLMTSMLANADAIVHNIQKILSYLNMLK